MRRKTRWPCALGCAVLAAGLVGSTGCFHLRAPAAPQPDCTLACQELPRGCRNRVYVFLVNGLDPANCGNLTGLRDYLHELGFIKTYYGQVFHASHFAKEICRIRCEEPDARFVLIGFDIGANAIGALARSVAPDGVLIDLAVYLSGSCLKDGAADRPDNVVRALNIQGGGCLDKERSLAAAENIQLPGTSHYAPPTHPYTLEVLAHELAQVAAQVPVAVPAAPPPAPDAELAPTPRPVAGPPPGPRDEWDFLKPVSRLGQRKAPDRP